MGKSLEQLHFKAFTECLTYDNIKANRYRSIELFYLFKKAELKAQKVVADPLFAGTNTVELEALIANEYQIFAQRMCRSSMIRNGHTAKWFKAVIADEIVKVFLLPLARFFGFSLKGNMHLM